MTELMLLLLLSLAAVAACSASWTESAQRRVAVAFRRLRHACNLLLHFKLRFPVDQPAVIKPSVSISDASKPDAAAVPVAVATSPRVCDPPSTESLDVGRNFIYLLLLLLQFGQVMISLN